jgi:hypothetical protein
LKDKEFISEVAESISRCPLRNIKLRKTSGPGNKTLSSQEGRFLNTASQISRFNNKYIAPSRNDLLLKEMKKVQDFNQILLIQDSTALAFHQHQQHLLTRESTKTSPNFHRPSRTPSQNPLKTHVSYLNMLIS